MAPEDSRRLIARGDAHDAAGRFEEALALYRDAALDPEARYDALIKASRMQATLRRHHDALATLNEATTVQPKNPLAFYRRSFLRLLMCDFQGGWRDYETRLVCDEFLASALNPKLQPSIRVNAQLADLAGKRILLVPEQGVGDQIMFASMVPDLAQVAASVTLACERRLRGLFANSFPGVECVDSLAGHTPSDFDHVVALGSLGRLFRNRLEDFPARGYLNPRKALVADWADRLGPRPTGLRIGVSWRGGIQATGTRRRSTTLETFAPILRLPGCEVISLQYGDVADEVAAANARLGTAVQVFPKADIDDFEWLGALIRNLDVVVSVQNTNVHLTGALGKDCLTLLPANPEWRYTLTAATMPWYGSVRLLRQPEPGAWAPVVEQAAEQLAARL